MTQNQTGKATKTLNYGGCQEILKHSETTTTRFTSHVFAVTVLQLCNLRIFRFILGGSSRSGALNRSSSFLAKRLKAIITIKIGMPTIKFCD